MSITQNKKFSPSKIFDNADLSMEILDEWVKGRGNGLYSPVTYKSPGPYGISPTPGIQQVREEISEFVSEIVGKKINGTVVEIGLGRFGSSHFLWRTIFKNVLTIEVSSERCRAFTESYADFAGGHSCGDDGRSMFIYGPSQDPKVVKKTFDAVGGEIDMLFIDGDHSYGAVLCDWLLYHKLVRPGGIVAFHDIATEKKHESEVQALIQKLEAGTIDGVARKIRKIVYNEDTGIGYYIVK
jgi:hypothetical protein